MSETFYDKSEITLLLFSLRLKQGSKVTNTFQVAFFIPHVLLQVLISKGLKDLKQKNLGDGILAQPRIERGTAIMRNNTATTLSLHPNTFYFALTYKYFLSPSLV